MIKGKLSIQVQKVELIRDTDSTGALDPWVSFKIGAQEFKTKTLQDGGLKGQFNQNFCIQINNNQEFLNVKVMDEDLTSSEMIGMAIHDINVYKKNPNKAHPCTLVVMYDQKEAGKVFLQFYFTPVVAKTLCLLIKKATLLQDQDFWNKQDPFCVVTVGTQTKKTSIKQQAGKTPVWNQELTFEILSDNPKILIQVRDDDGDNGQKFDECGACSLFLNDLKGKGAQPKLNLSYKQKSAGQIQIAWKLK